MDGKKTLELKFLHQVLFTEVGLRGRPGLFEGAVVWLQLVSAKLGVLRKKRGVFCYG